MICGMTCGFPDLHDRPEIAVLPDRGYDTAELSIRTHDDSLVEVLMLNPADLRRLAEVCTAAADLIEDRAGRRAARVAKQEAGWKARRRSPAVVSA